MSNDERQKVDAAIDALFEAAPPADTAHPEFWGAQFDHGLAWVQFPEGLGGLGVSPRWQGEVNRRIEEAGGSTGNRYRNVLGIGMGAGTLIAHGTEEHQRRFLRPMFTLEEIWCQLFSEPGAGSDLAALATTAVREGDTWIVNGQKVWTTLAHLAKWGLLVARTDPDLPKHAGLTYFVVDMEGDGVDVRPLYQITGEAEFNEVYFDDAQIPDDLRIGEVGQGWTVAMATLMNERVAIGANVTPRGSGAIANALEAWEAIDVDERDEATRDQLVRYWIEAEALRLTTIRAGEARKSGTPGPEGSTGKLHWSDLNKSISTFTVDLLGAGGMVHEAGYTFSRPTESSTRSNDPVVGYLRARANSIEGGTSEIMKNILGERVLGLPGEPRVDKNVPWREVPRS
ncbi:acyl-CoA dehydrogenase family protein [Nitriliruptor alkaliphilus]|uniref:acyl-CoA dehydrogenase family protein n=1 Tax=Nitriliruptor alkaliphilus TaxID=427918 RepID=UPI0006962F1E|nr:acyl-CoA dehydrogenase family protein [Nitriliruptor alkaliphilus]